jgi:hypothetical protein
MTNTETATRWNRCTAACGCADVNVKDNGCRCKGGCERGSADRYQMRAYAIAINEAMTGFTMTADGMLVCPITRKAFHVSHGEVDKANPHAGYVAGNVVLVSRQGNQERGKLQQHYGDMAGAARYIVDVAIASADVTVTRKRDLTGDVRDALRSVAGGDAPSATFHNVLAGPYGTR